MSPEIINGQDFDLPTDVFSLGIIFLEILSHKLVDQHTFIVSSIYSCIFTSDTDRSELHLPSLPVPMRSAVVPPRVVPKHSLTLLSIAAKSFPRQDQS